MKLEYLTEWQCHEPYDLYGDCNHAVVGFTLVMEVMPVGKVLAEVHRHQIWLKNWQLHAKGACTSRDVKQFSHYSLLTVHTLELYCHTPRNLVTEGKHTGSSAQRRISSDAFFQMSIQELVLTVIVNGHETYTTYHNQASYPMCVFTHCALAHDHHLYLCVV